MAPFGSRVQRRDASGSAGIDICAPGNEQRHLFYAAHAGPLPQGCAAVTVSLIDIQPLPNQPADQFVRAVQASQSGAFGLLHQYPSPLHTTSALPVDRHRRIRGKASNCQRSISNRKSQNVHAVLSQLVLGRCDLRSPPSFCNVTAIYLGHGATSRIRCLDD